MLWLPGTGGFSTWDQPGTAGGAAVRLHPNGLMTPSGLLFSVWNKPTESPAKLMTTAVIRGRTLAKEKGGNEDDCKI